MLTKRTPGRQERPSLATISEQIVDDAFTGPQGGHDLMPGMPTFAHHKRSAMKPSVSAAAAGASW
jgi:hypothetical protein